MQQLMEGKGLPESNMREIARHLKTFKTVPRVVGMPDEWSNAGGSQKGKVVSRNKRERTWDDLSSDEGEERWRHPGESEWDDQSEDEDDGRKAEEEQRGMTPHRETNPQVQEMMKEYYKQYNFILGGAICTKAGVTLEDLGIGNACLSYILGKCTRKGCTQSRWHPRAFDASPEEVRSLCDKLKRGVDAMTRPKRRRRW